MYSTGSDRREDGGSENISQNRYIHMYMYTTHTILQSAMHIHVHVHVCVYTCASLV